MYDVLSDLAADGCLSCLPTDERVRALERIIPPGMVQRVLEQTGHARRRYTAVPAWLAVWMVIGLGLFANDSATQIYKRLQRFRPGRTPRRSTLGEARKGLGCAVTRRLAAQAVRLHGDEGTPGCFYKGMRLMALDGFTLDLPDTPANARVFGRPRGRKGQGAFPQARVVALCEAGTHVTWRWQVKPCRRGEIGVAPTLLRHLGEDMLALWDSNFFSHKALATVRGRRAHLLCRLKRNVLKEPEEVLPDGTYLATSYPSAKHRRHDEGGIVVRVIEYTLSDPGRPGQGQVRRLLTTLLGPEEYPAEDLVVLYHERWEQELAIDELKTHQRGRAVLRSQAPRGVVQEIDGLLLAHYVVRAVMAEAAGGEGLAPRALSFTGTLKVLRARLPEAPRDPADVHGRRRWWQDLLAEVAELVLEPRRDRCNPRVVRRPAGKWPKKREQHRHKHKPTMPFRDAILLC